VPKKKTDCKNCDDLTARLDRLEKRLEIQEESAKHWKKRWAIVDDKLRVAEGEITLLKVENAKLKKVIEKKDAQISSLQKKLFGASTEATTPEEPVDETLEAAPPKRPRGKQVGSKGFGRKIRTELPVEELVHDVNPNQKHCSKCGCKRTELPFTEDSEEIDFSYRLVRIRHKRRKYKQVCACKNEQPIVTAAAPAKLIHKGMFSTEFWSHVLLEKFLLQRPISRICMSLDLHGLSVSEGTIASGLKHLTKLFARLYNAILHEARFSSHWQMDETHWKVFTDLQGKANHTWWLWVTETSNVTVFKLDPSRSSAVPMKLLKGIETGIVTCDRYSAYKPLQEQGILLSYCWSHVRRDFIKLKDGYPTLKSFATKWIKQIDDLFHLNKLRTSKSNAELDVHGVCERMEKEAKRLLKRKDLHEEARSTLVSLLNHWSGLTLFLKFPTIPMDNNASERALRNPVVGRKNYYGSRSIWSGNLAVMLFSIFATVKKNKGDPRQFLNRYLKACAENNGRPPEDLSPFLPWKTALPEQLRMVH
jgi:transposase